MGFLDADHGYVGDTPFTHCTSQANAALQTRISESDHQDARTYKDLKADLGIFGGGHTRKGHSAESASVRP